MKAHQSWPKSAQNGAQFCFSQKSHIFWKRRTILNPKTLVFCIFVLKFFLKCQNVAIFSSFTGFFWVFSKIFFKKVYSFCFIKVHLKNSRSHLTLKVAPMCYKAHVIEHSALLWYVGLYTQPFWPFRELYLHIYFINKI